MCGASTQRRVYSSLIGWRSPVCDRGTEHFFFEAVEGPVTSTSALRAVSGGQRLHCATLPSRTVISQAAWECDTREGYLLTPDEASCMPAAKSDQPTPPRTLSLGAPTLPRAFPDDI